MTEKQMIELINDVRYKLLKNSKFTLSDKLLRVVRVLESRPEATSNYIACDDCGHHTKEDELKISGKLCPDCYTEATESPQEGESVEVRLSNLENQMKCHDRHYVTNQGAIQAILNRLNKSDDRISKLEEESAKLKHNHETLASEVLINKQDIKKLGLAFGKVIHTLNNNTDEVMKAYNCLAERMEFQTKDREETDSAAD